MDINTHNLICNFGRHKGKPFTQIPASYLKWMVNSNHSQIKIAEAELKRRGTITPELDISGHAIDRASLSCRKVWHETRSKDEGLHAWLVRITMEALEKNVTDNKGKYKWKTLRLVIEQDGKWPVLKTVMNKRKI